MAILKIFEAGTSSYYVSLVITLTSATEGGGSELHPRISIQEQTPEEEQNVRYPLRSRLLFA